MKYLLFCLLMLHSAHAEVQQNFGIWSPIFLTFPVGSKFLGYAEFQPRFTGEGIPLDQLFFRPAFGYKLAKQFSLWQGYAWLGNFRPTFKWEHRLYQQMLYHAIFKFLTLQSRTRFEQRFIESTNAVSLRGRTQLRINIPMTQKRDWLFVVSDEVFFHLNSVQNGPQSGFDQNRLFVGTNFQFSPQISLDVGYQLQTIKNSVWRINHNLVLQVFINL